jgi:hypothetical protein
MGKRSGKEIQKKIALLAREGITVSRGRIYNFKTVLYTFN